MKNNVINTILAGASSLILHIVLLGLFVIGIETQSTTHFIAQPKVDIVKATVMDESKVLEEMNHLQQLEDKKRQAELDRQAKIDKKLAKTQKELELKKEEFIDQTERVKIEQKQHEYLAKQEQEKIASFLTSVDTKIEQLAKKEELLGQYKKGVMQKIFNQEIRFKADDGSEFPEWEEKKLSSLCNIQKGSQLNKDTLTETGNHPAINGGINPSGYTSEYNTEANTITISEGGNSCGYVNFITTKFWSGGHNYSLQDLKTNIENKYLFQYLKHNENSIMRLRVGSGLPNIQKNEINNYFSNLKTYLNDE